MTTNSTIDYEAARKVYVEVVAEMRRNYRFDGGELTKAIVDAAYAKGDN